MGIAVVVVLTRICFRFKRHSYTAQQTDIRRLQCVTGSYYGNTYRTYHFIRIFGYGRLRSDLQESYVSVSSTIVLETISTVDLCTRSLGLSFDTLYSFAPQGAPEFGSSHCDFISALVLLPVRCIKWSLFGGTKRDFLIVVAAIKIDGPLTFSSSSILL